MKGKRAWIWKVGRVVLAVVLLAAIFKFYIRMSDVVHLAGGAEVTGTITGLTDSEIVLTQHGRTTTLPLSDLATRKGEPWIDRGLVSLLTMMMKSPREFAIAFMLLAVAPVIASWRWQMLLLAQDIRISFWRAAELTFIGLFFNNFMPGLTGGDLVKAYYAAKLTHERKTHAVVTVFLDRLIGMVALGIVAGAAILVGLFGAGGITGSEYREASWFVGVFVAASVAGALAFYSRRLRALTLRLVRALPGFKRVSRTGFAQKASGLIKRVDSALFLYRYKKMVLAATTAVSFVAHASAIVSIYYIGQALGIKEADLLSYFVVVPVCFIISSVPLTPAGWGVGEVVFQVMFGAVGVGKTAAVTMSVLYRLTQAIWTLPGGAVLLFQRDRATVEEVEKEMSIDGEIPEEKGAGQGD